MRIGIDARELFDRPTGVGRYLAEILAQWAALPEARRHQFVLYRPENARSERPLPGADLLAPTIRSVGRGGGTYWEQVSLPLAMRRDGLDVLFAPAYTAPIAIRTPVALTIHDLSFLAHPEWFKPRERIRRAWLTKAAARRARVVMTDSAFSGSEIESRLGVGRDRVRVIPLGLTWGGSAASPPGAATPDGPAARDRRAPLVLYVGSIFNRRRLPDLIQAFAALSAAHPDARLEIVGENRTWPKVDLTVANRVSIHSYVSEEALESLYRRASVFAFLSDYEGFGLTPLEALGHGVPIVVLDTAVAREVYGQAAAYVSPGDTAGTAAVLAALIDDASARASLLGQAPAVLARYRWDRTASLTLDAIVSAAGGSARD
jgi:glycosyltransferase involved in cell wall biosynthesis